MFTQYLSEVLGIPYKSLPLRDIRNLPKIEISRGEFLLKEGEICQSIFFVEKGLLRMYSISQNAKEHIIQFAPENWLVVDRNSVYFNETSDYYIDAIEDSIVTALDVNFFYQLQEKYPEIWKNHILLLHKHTISLQKRINLLLGANAEERYLEFMKIYPNILQRAPLWMIASYLGITPESLSRIRKEILKK